MGRSVWAAGVAAAVVLGGCNVVGPALMIAHGPDKTAAVHELERDVATVVFVSDPQSFLPRRSLRQGIADEASRWLLDSGTLTKVIEARAALAASTADQPGQPMDIVSLGKSVKADVVVYVMVDSFTLAGPDRTYTPSARVRVKVIDTRGDKGRVWPETTSGYAVAVTPPPDASGGPTSLAGAVSAEAKLGAEVGRQVAELFYSHETKRHVKE